MKPRVICVVVLTITGIAGLAHAVGPVVTSFVGGGGPFGSYYGTLLPCGDVVGFRFTADADMLITDLGIYDDGADGVLNSPHQVGLWRDSDQALLASVTVDQAGTLLNGYFYAPIAPIALVGGQRYTIGAMYSSDDLESYYSGPSAITLNGISATVAVAPAAADLCFVYPTTESAGNLGRIGPNAIGGDVPVELMSFSVE